MSNSLTSEVYALLPGTLSRTRDFCLVDSATELKQLLRSYSVLRVAFHFDPYCDKAADELKEVCLVANKAGADVYTYSTSHLEWLENLTIQLGASRHCSHLTDIRAVENEH